LRTLFHALGTVQHISTSNIMLARTHQGQFDLILNVFNMKSTASRLATYQCVDNIRSQLLHQLTHTCRCCTLATIDSKKRLGNGNGDFGWFKTDNGTITANDAVIVQTGLIGTRGRSSGGQRADTGDIRRRLGRNFLCRVHEELLLAECRRLPCVIKKEKTGTATGSAKRGNRTSTTKMLGS